MKYLIQLIAGLLVTTLLPAEISAKRPEIIELDHIVAVVNRNVITASELARKVSQIRQRLAEKKTQLPPPDVLRKQILDSMVIEQIQVQLAHTSGIRIDDERLNLVISNIAEQNKMSLENFVSTIEKDGITFAHFREEIRKEVIISQLRKNRVGNRILVSEQEVDYQLSKLENKLSLNDEYHLAHILVAIPESATPDQIESARAKANDITAKLNLGADFAKTAVSSSDGQRALQGGDLGWIKRGQLPTGFADIVPKLEIGAITKSVRSTSGFHIVKVINKRILSRKHLIQQTLARHILIKPNAVISNAEASGKIMRIYERISGGSDFGALARASSDDTASAVDGGNLGWVSPGKMVSEFEDVMKRLSPGQISKPFESRFGWHIVQVLSRREHDDTEQYLRNQARTQIHKRKVNEETESWLRRIRDEAYVEYRLNE